MSNSKEKSGSRAAIEAWETEADITLDEADRYAQADEAISRLFPEPEPEDGRLLFSVDPDVEPELRETDFDISSDRIHMLNESCVAEGEEFESVPYASDDTIRELGAIAVGPAAEASESRIEHGCHSLLAMYRSRWGNAHTW